MSSVHYNTALNILFLYITVLYHYVLYSISLNRVSLVNDNKHVPVQFRPLQSLATLNGFHLSDLHVLP